MKNFYRDGGLVISISALLVLVFVLSGYIYTLSISIFWVAAPFIVLLSGFAIGKLIQVTRRTFQYFQHIDDEIDAANHLSLYSFPLGIAVLDKSRKIIWYNSVFGEDFPDSAVYGSSINSIISDIPIKKLFDEKGQEIRFGDKFYRVYASYPKEETASEIFLVYFRNITKTKYLEHELKITHPVVMAVIIDGFDELTANNLESEKAHVSVQIDKILEDFISNTNGILRKSGLDRFWAVVEEQHIQQLIDEKVKLLDKARAITVDDRTNVTLSIGIGTTGKNLAESDSFAKQALDMALGRGGDQAAVKTAVGFEFYGGASKGIERQTKVRARIITNSLINYIENSDRVYVMGHKFSDLDSMGSSIGLSAAIRNLGKDAYAVADRNTSLSGALIDKIKLSENGKTSLFISPAAAKEHFTEKTLLIIVDTHNPKLVEDNELYQMAKTIVVIDHHRKMVDHIDNAKIFHHEPYASSASEMVAEMIQYFGNAGKISANYAEALLAGIMLDTKNFTLKTGVRTFEAAAYLRRLGADTIAVKSLFTNSIETYKHKAQLVASADIYKRCAITAAETITSEMRLTAPQAADELLGITNVDASFVMYISPNNELCISARSLGAISVQLIMEALGGGGHQTMAAAQIKDTSVEKGRKMLEAAIDNYYTNNLQTDKK